MTTITIQDIAQRRKEIAELDETITTREDLAIIVEYLDLLKTRTKKKAELKEREDAYRSNCAQEFIDTKKTEFDGAKLQMFKAIQYSVNDAIEWITRKNLFDELCITEVKLDKRAFEDIAKTLDLNFVDVSEVGKVKIDSDLSKYLEDEGVQDEQQ